MYIGTPTSNNISKCPDTANDINVSIRSQGHKFAFIYRSETGTIGKFLLYLKVTILCSFCITIRQPIDSDFEVAARFALAILRIKREPVFMVLNES